MKNLKVKQVAEEAGVGIETIRYYEKIGTLPLPSKTDSGYRIYNDSTVNQIKFIKKMQEIGFSLEEIKVLLSLQNYSVRNNCLQMELKLKSKIGIVDKKIAELKKVKKQLICMEKLCEKNEEKEKCPILTNFDEE